MKWTTVVATSFGCFLTLCLGSAASQASVYYFNTDLNVDTDARQIPLLNADQSQLVLSDFTGTSDMYELNSETDSYLVSILKSVGLFSPRRKNDAVVIAVDNLQDDDDSTIDEQPAFHVKTMPDYDGIETMCNNMINDMQEMFGGMALSLREGVRVVTGRHESSFWHKRMHGMHGMHGMQDSYDEQLDNDIADIQALGQHSTKGDGAVLHLTSLSGLRGKKLHQSRKKLVDAVKQLANKQQSIKIALIALSPNNVRDSFDWKMRRRDLSSSVNQNISSQSVFDSAEKCEKSTNSCSGHGSCQKNGPAGYSCVCKSTYDDSRKKTTRWGGNACQKKDISVETQLFLWTGIGIVLVLTWSIKLLFSIGSDPLPGILGAATDQKS